MRFSKTASNELEWKEGVYSASFQVSFPNYSLTLSENQRERGGYDYVISILDADGSIIDTFSDIDLGEGYYSKMVELYQNARRQALGVDKALDEILNELDPPSF